MLYYENPNQKSVIIDYWLSIYDDKLTLILSGNSDENKLVSYDNLFTEKDKN